MSTLALHSEPKRLWDSHITPNNPKWLQENLTEMDDKVRAMIKIINEDADSFARRAEMYYKKRPELMRLIEDLYRAYRALAERHNQMTVELRLAHRTIPEAYPNRLDHIPSSTSEPFLPVSLSPQLAHRAFFCPDEYDFGLSRKGLKQLVEMFQMVDGDSISEQCSCLSADELLGFEANDLIQRITEKDKELLQNLSEVEELMNQVYVTEFRLVQVEAALDSLQNLHFQSQEEIEMLENLKRYNLGLERKVHQLNKHIGELEEMRIKNLRLEEISFQEKAEREALLMKVEYMEEKNGIFEGHLYDLHIELESYKEKMKAMQEENATIQEENKCLQDNLSKSEEEKSILIEEALSFNFQSAIFSNVIEELHCLREAYTDVEIELAVIEIEKMHLRELNDQYLSELNGYKCDLELWEDVAESYYYELNACAVRESLFESKVREVSGLCKILEDLGVRRCIEIERMNSKNKGLEDKLSAYAHVASLEVHLTSTSKDQESTVDEIYEMHPPITNDITSSMLDGLTKLNPSINLQPLRIIHNEECSWFTPGTPEIMDETRMKDILYDHVSDCSPSSYQRSCGSKEPEVSRKVTELKEVETGKIIIERLSSDAQQLERLNLSVQELKSNINSNKKSNLTKAVEYKRLSDQLQNIEASIAELVDVNTKLINTIKDFSSLSCVDSFEQAQRRITRQARKGAERIGRLQVDVQKMQYLLLRLEDEENENNESLRNRKGISLSDLLYSHGSRRRKQRKLHICGCDTKDVLDPHIKKFVKHDNKLPGMQTNSSLLSPCIR